MSETRQEKIARLRKELEQIVEEVGRDAPQDSETEDALEDLSHLLMRRPNCAVTVDWWDDCRCHGSPGSDSLSATTPTELGYKLADHGHADHEDVDCIAWSVPLTEQERLEARAAFAERHAFLTLENQLHSAHEKLKMAAKHLRTERDTAAADLVRISPELKEDAIARRLEACKDLENRAQLAGQQAVDAGHRLAAHRASWKTG